MRLRLTSLILLLTIYNGCISFRSNDLPKYENELSVVEKIPKKLSYNLAFTYVQLENKQEVQVFPEVITGRNEQLTRILNESNLLEPGIDGKADFQIEAKIIDDRSGFPLLDILCIFTSLVIPTYANHTVKATFEIKNKSGKSLGIVEKSESFTTITEIVLLLVAPFNRSNKKIDDIYRDLFRANLDEVVRKNYFGKFTIQAKTQ